MAYPVGGLPLHNFGNCLLRFLTALINTKNLSGHYEPLGLLVRWNSGAYSAALPSRARARRNRLRYCAAPTFSISAM